MATIKDVAAYANLSVPVVSKYLKNPQSVRADTRQRLEEAIAALNYTPSLAARALRTGRTNMILVVTPSIENWKVNLLLNGLQSMASKRGITLILLTEETLAHLYAQASSSALSAYPVDGMLLCYPANHSLVQRFAEEVSTIPRVVMGWPIWDNVSTYLWDVSKPAYLLTRHLLEMGHQRIGFLGMIPKNEFFLTHFNREASFRQALREADAPLYESLIYLAPADRSQVHDDNADYHVGLMGAEYLLSREKPPTAIVAENENLAAACQNWAISHGFSVPQELAIVSCEENALCSRVLPPITSARSPLVETAQMALEKLLAIIDGKDSGQVEMVLPTDLPTHLCIRRSSDPSQPPICE